MLQKNSRDPIEECSLKDEGSQKCQSTCPKLKDKSFEQQIRYQTIYTRDLLIGLISYITLA